METIEVNGVFEGGGIRGVALAGAAAAALDAGLRFTRTVGTSAGALVAALVAAGYSGDQLSDTVCEVDWPGLLDPVRGSRIPLIGRNLALVFHRGLYKGDRLERVWAELLADKGVRVFANLAPGALTVVASDLNHARGVPLPEGLEHYGIDPATFSVARAVRMSAAVPFLFQPVAMRDKVTGEQILMADGAMAANFPIGLAPENRPVVGFRVTSDGTVHPHKTIRGPASLARAVVIAGIRARYDLPREEIDHASIIDVPVSADLDFSISRDEARRTFDRGRAVAAARFDELMPTLLGSESID